MQIEVEDSGRLHLIVQPDGTGGNYRFKDPEFGWSPVQPLGIDAYGSYDFAVTPQGAAHLLYQDIDGGHILSRSPVVAVTPQWSTREQRLQLPATMNHPTLAFTHKVASGDRSGQSAFSVAIANDITSTIVFSSTDVGTWHHAWANLEPWAGSEITVTFAVSQVGDETYYSVYLDDVSIGDWTTPVIAAVSPSRIPQSWDGTPLTITGDNFATTPVVRIGETSLMAVTRVDARTLTAIIPSGIGPGTWD